jgi:hypothetical protein
MIMIQDTDRPKCQNKNELEALRRNLYTLIDIYDYTDIAILKASAELDNCILEHMGSKNHNYNGKNEK